MVTPICCLCSAPIADPDDLVCDACYARIPLAKEVPEAPSRRAKLDADGQPAARFGQSRRTTRDVCELLGIVKGVLFDGVVSDAEVRALSQWLETHPDAHADWATRTVWERLKHATADGVIDDAERQDLVATLDALVGGTVTAQTGADAATWLPLCRPVPTIEWTGHLYVFTGKFAFGTRDTCEREVERRGGACTSSVSGRTTFVVIGTFASRDWATTSYGRKIQAAVELRERGTPLRIVSEDHWAAAL